MYMVYSIKKTYGSGGKTQENKDHELFSPFEINSPNLQTRQVKYLENRSYHISQQFKHDGFLKIWFTNSSSARNKIYASVYQVKRIPFSFAHQVLDMF